MDQPFGPIYGPEGEQYKTYDNTPKTWNYPGYHLGQELVIGERRWRFCRAGASALAAGKLMQMELPDGNFDTLAVAAAAAVGDKTVSVTLPANSITKNLWTDGYMIVELHGVSTPGQMYRVVSHPASAGSEAVTFTLANGLVAALTTSSKVTFWKNPYADVIIHPSPPTAKVVGVPSVAIAATDYGWLQVSGPASVLTDSTVTINQQVVASPSVDGSVSNALLTEATPNTFIQPIVGVVIEVAPDTDYGGIWLQLA